VLTLPPALQERDFRRFWLSLLGSGFGAQMASVAIGWQVYAIHRSAFDLGLIGLAEFLPLLLLALPAGHVADRLPRTTIAAGSNLAEALVAALLLLVTLEGAHELWPFVLLAALTGVAGAFGSPAARALAPEIVPAEFLAAAMALRSVAGQIATVSGPAIGGLLFAVWPEAVYAVAAALLLASALLVLTIRRPDVVTTGEAPRLQSVLLGVRFIRRTPILFGAISLDLFAVLFGGAVALLPLYARSILHTGPFGLGILRSATAIGALAAGIMLTRRPLRGRAGRTLLWSVGIFGVSIVVFGLSRWFLLSFVALAVGGFADMLSMNIRSTASALATPNELRGRVTAVENVFISASNELGAFESGLAAALIGAVPAVVGGGLITIALAATWGRLFPALGRVDRLSDVRPELVSDAGGV
jgi:hypothetical protein